VNTSKRIKSSIGKFHYNKGGRIELQEERYVLDHSREFYLFDIIPMGAVRMTKSDKWKTNPNHIDPRKRQRKSVKEYFNFKNELVAQALQLKFELGTYFDAVYFLPMPDSWSNKKKEKMNGMPCKSRPDTDNITKGVKDALRKEDSDIWWEKAEKRWAYKGSIIIFT
jgi:Holliday junction resolvase RusA-like endonuclease